MKKIIAMILTVTLCVLLAACSAGPKNAPQKGANNFASAAGIDRSSAGSASPSAAQIASEAAQPAEGLPAETYMPQYHTCPGCGAGQIYSPIFDANGIPMQEYIPCGNCGGTGMLYY